MRMLGKDIVKFIDDNQLEDFEIQIKFDFEKNGIVDYRLISLKHLGDSGDKVIYIEGHHLGSYTKGLTGSDLVKMIDDNNLHDFKVNIGFNAGISPNMSYLVVLLKEAEYIGYDNKTAYLRGELFSWEWINI